MDKKGFTLIEIIIAISLIILISVGSFIGIKLQNNNDNDKINDIILNAATLYANNEKDEKGQTYIEAVNSYAKGAKIPLSVLVNKGYLEEKYKKTIEEKYKNKNSNNKSLYVLLALEEDYCETGATYTLSWTMDINDSVVYLCDTHKNPDSLKVTEVPKIRVDLSKVAVSENYYNNATEEQKEYLTKDENGLYIYYNESTQRIYNYFRGAVTNNYIKLGSYTDSSGNKNDLYWRIVWYNSDKKMKLILNDSIPLDEVYQNDQVANLNDGDVLTYFSYQQSPSLASYSGSYLFLNKDASISERYSSSCAITIHEYDIQEEKLLKEKYNDYKIENNLNANTNNFYYNSMSLWYDDTNLSDFNFIMKENNFCYNNITDDNIDYNVISSLDCGDGSKLSNYSYVQYNRSLKLGFLTYGEAKRAGFIENTAANINIKQSNNYLFDTVKDNIILSDLNFVNSYTTKIYYLNDSGIGIGDIYSKIRKNSYNTYRLLKNSNVIDSFISSECGNTINSGYSMKVSNVSLLASKVRPVIVLDLENYELSDALGTKENPYTIVEKS